MELGNQSKQSGFTLIEIIAVLVIMGLLAAVALPKYQSFLEEAELKSLDISVSAAQSRLTMVYSLQLIQNSGVATVSGILSEVNGDANCGVTDLSNTVQCATGGSGVLITVTSNSTGATSTGTWELP